MDNIVLAADLGGTNLRMAAVGAGGGVLSRAKTQTPRSLDAQDIVDAFFFSARDCLGSGFDRSNVRSIGAAIPAMSIDSSQGIVRKAANLPSLNGFALGPAVSTALGI